MSTDTEFFLRILGSAPILRKDLRLRRKSFSLLTGASGKTARRRTASQIDSTSTDQPPSRLLVDR
jgi:hypothetical protein